MPGFCQKCYSRFHTPANFAILINILLIVVTSVSFALVWKDLASPKIFHSSLYPIFLHIVCLSVICLLIGFHTYVIFYRNRFSGCFPTVGFFIYILMELILVVNAFCMEHENKVILYVICGLVFALLSFYTQCVSWHNNRWTDYQRMLHEEHINRQIESSIRRGGDCVNIPLKGPVSNAFKSNLKMSAPGPSTRRN